MTHGRRRGLSIDPGGEHVGVALWDSHVGGWRCTKMYETTPDVYADKLWHSLNGMPEFEWVAIESFQLRGDKAKQQTGSSFVEVQLIGFTKYLCRMLGIEYREVTPATRSAAWTKAKAVGYRFDPDPAGHATSAVCVGLVATGWKATRHIPGDGVGIDT